MLRPNILRARIQKNEKDMRLYTFCRNIFIIFLIISPSLLIFPPWIFLIFLSISILLAIIFEILRNDSKLLCKEDLIYYARLVKTGVYPTSVFDAQLQFLVQKLLPNLDFQKRNSLSIMNSKPIRKQKAKKLGICMICHSPLYKSTRKMKCPACGASGHKAHFIAWLKFNQQCPRCGIPLKYRKYKGLEILGKTSPPLLPPEDQPFPLSEHPPSRSSDLNILDECIICHLPITDNQALILCPHCLSCAHTTHFLEWVKIKGYCPFCSTPLKLFDFLKYDMERLIEYNPMRSR